jgi:hypothetical protein
MNKKCPDCNLINFPNAENCKRCAADLRSFKTAQTVAEKPPRSLKTKLLRRAAVCFAMCLFTIFGFYLSLLVSAKRLSYDEKQKIERAVRILEEKGFDREVFLLRYLTAYRATDNWLNASTREENAYAATNFPFEIMTIYPDFFLYSQDETDAAAILLHEAQHLMGADEPEAYEYVWTNRHRLGWTGETHGNSKVYRNTERQTQEFAPHLFQCGGKTSNDCTE